MNSIVAKPWDAFGEAIIRDPTGLHARPAVKLTRRAKSHRAEIEVRAGGEGAWINAKSPNAVMKLKAANGERLYFRALGEDAAAAIAAMVALVEQDFDG